MTGPTRKDHPARAKKALACPLALAGLLVVISMSGATQSQSGDPMIEGQPLTVTDPDALLPIKSLDASAICFVDMGDSGGYLIDDPVILTVTGTCIGNATSNDVRLDGLEVFAGKRIGWGELDGQPLGEPESPARFWYHDSDGSGSYSPGNPIYVKLHQFGEQKVTISDVRITSLADHPAGSKVRQGDSDIGSTLKALGTSKELVRYVDTRDNGNFTAGDLLYLPLDPKKETVSPGDVRLLAMGDGRPFASLVSHDSLETAGTLTKINRPLCTVPTDPEAGYQPGDPLYLSLAGACSGTVAEGDIRVSRGPTWEAGVRVQFTDPDHGGDYKPLSEARAGWVAYNATEGLDRLLVVKLHDINTATDTDAVQPLDLVLSPTHRGAGALLHPEDPLIGENWQDLGTFAGLVAFVKTQAGNTPGPTDMFYIAPGAKDGESLKPGHVRLSQTQTLPFGGPVGLQTGEVVPKLERQTARVCSPSLIPDEYTRGDPVYLHLGSSCPGTVQPGLIRLTHVDDYPGLSTVRTNDTDQGISLKSAPNTLQWKYHDADQNSAFNTGDTLYLDLVDPDDDEVKHGDIRITRLGSLPAGQAIGPGSQDNGNPLKPLGKVNEHIAIIQFDDQDPIVYITKDPKSTHVLLHDVRLSALPAPFTAPPAEPYQQPIIPEPPASSDPPPTDGTTDDEFHDDETWDQTEDEDEVVPGPGIIILLVLLGAGVWWVRRRDQAIR